jgi:hypothetical protein
MFQFWRSLTWRQAEPGELGHNIAHRQAFIVLDIHRLKQAHFKPVHFWRIFSKPFARQFRQGQYG